MDCNTSVKPVVPGSFREPSSNRLAGFIHRHRKCTFKHPCGYSNRRNGFTLVELLVVIGIIALLVGILMPTLGAARRSAQSTTCLAVQRQIGTGAIMHAQTHLGYYPIAGDFVGPATPQGLNDPFQRKYTYQTISETWFRGTTIAPWHAAIALQFSKKTANTGVNNSEIEVDETGLRTYLKYFLCPSHSSSAAELPNALIYRANGLIWFLQQSYVINEAVFGVNDAMGRYRGKASKVRRPSQTVMLADGVQSGGRPAGMVASANGMNWITFINNTKNPPVTLADAFLQNGKAGDKKNFDMHRHKGKINLLFFDGHAETRVINARDLQNVYLLAD